MVSGRFTVRSGKVCEAGCREVDRWDVIRCLVNSVGDSVTGVQLDGGQDGLTAGSGGGNSHWSGCKGCGSWQSSNWGSGVWEASSVGVSSEGKASGVWEWESGNSWSGSSSGLLVSGSLAIKERSSVGEDGVSSDLGGDLSGLLLNRLDNWGVGNSTGSWESSNWGSSVGQWKASSKGKSSVWETSITKGKSSNSWSGFLISITSLSLRSSSWGSEWFNSWGGWADWEVGAGNLESVDGISDIVDGLEETVGVNVLVGAGGHSIGVSGLGTGGWTSGVSKRELSELILSMEL